MSSFPASHRLRRGRYSEQNRIYLLTANTLHRQPIFLNWRVGRRVVEQFKRAQEQGLATSLAWVVMPDHVHWLVQLKDGARLGDLVRRLKARVTMVLGAPVWQRGFHDHALRKEEDVAGTARYVVANPVRAGLVRRVGDYPHWDAVWLGS